MITRSIPNLMKTNKTYINRLLRDILFYGITTIESPRKFAKVYYLNALLKYPGKSQFAVYWLCNRQLYNIMLNKAVYHIKPKTELEDDIDRTINKNQFYVNNHQKRKSQN